MPLTYTISSSDVLASPNLVAGVVFDFTNKKIQVPSSVNQVSGQWIVDHCRKAEDTFIGIGNTGDIAIVDGSGKVQLGVDPDTLLPIVTGVKAVLRSTWRIVTLKTSGQFVIFDVYKPDGSLPYDNVSGVDIRYRQSLDSSLVTTDSGGGSTLTPAQIWQYADRSLSSDGITQIITALLASQLGVAIDDIYTLLGFKPGSPLTATTTQHTAGTKRVLVNANETTQTTTLTRNDA